MGICFTREPDHNVGGNPDIIAKDAS